MITVLPKELVNQIAAGEVVERPASVLKELIENSIDAGATEIKIYLEDAGIKKIQVVDNGSGIEAGDLERVFLKHATSKIEVLEDLNSIHTFGFRGEALAAISSVAGITVHTKHQKDTNGSEITLHEGQIQLVKPSSIASGTDIRVENLFAAIPARKKFLKSVATENKNLIDICNKFILSNPHISFTVSLDGTQKSYPAAEFKERVDKVLKVGIKELLSIRYDSQIKISGFVVHPRIFLKSKSSQYIFVNKRPVTDGTVYKAIIEGMGTFLMKNQLPGFVLCIDMPAQEVDVNVHPRKTEIRFANPSAVYMAVKLAVNINVNNFIKKETLEKIGAVQQQTTVEDVPQKYTAESTAIPVPSKTMAEEFESFLTQPKVKPIITSAAITNQSYQNDIKGVSLEKYGNATKQSLLFSKEILTEEHREEGIYLDFANATQLLNSYIITSNGKDILIIDQHAASERYFYEKFLKEIQNQKVISKLLLFPEVITLDFHEKALLEENKAIFEGMGFDYESFGDEEIRLTKVPDFVKMDNFSTVIHKIVKDVLEHENLSNIKDKIYHEIAAILACHTAVRFGDALSKAEIIQILKNLAVCEDPYNCPHGRPVIQDISKYDIEKRFKRCGL